MALQLAWLRAALPGPLAGCLGPASCQQGPQQASLVELARDQSSQSPPVTQLQTNHHSVLFFKNHAEGAQRASLAA